MFKLVSQKAEEPDIKLWTSAWSLKKQASSSKTSICFIDYAKAFNCVDHNKLGKFWEKWEDQTTWPAPWEICMPVNKQQLELDMEKQTVSKSGKEYIKAVYCKPAYLTYMQNTSRLPEEISITSDLKMIPSLWQKEKN